jgi:hypothetical protein
MANSSMEKGLSEKGVDKTLVEQAVKFINEKANETLYKGSEEIGAYILKKFFDDDIEKATSRNPRKPASYRALCTHPGLVLRPEALSVMVRVAAQEKFFLDKKLEVKKLSYSHKAELVKLGNDDKKVELVKKMLSKPMSVRQLQTRISKMRQEALPERSGSLTAIESHINDPIWLFEHPGRQKLLMDAEGRKASLSKMSSARRKKLLSRLEDALAKTEEWIEFYKALRMDLEEISKEKMKPKPKKVRTVGTSQQ